MKIYLLCFILLQIFLSNLLIAQTSPFKSYEEVMKWYSWRDSTCVANAEIFLIKKLGNNYFKKNIVFYGVYTTVLETVLFQDKSIKCENHRNIIPIYFDSITIIKYSLNIFNNSNCNRCMDSCKYLMDSVQAKKFLSKTNFKSKKYRITFILYGGDTAQPKWNITTIDYSSHGYEGGDFYNVDAITGKFEPGIYKRIP